MAFVETTYYEAGLQLAFRLEYRAEGFRPASRRGPHGPSPAEHPQAWLREIVCLTVRASESDDVRTLTRAEVPGPSAAQVRLSRAEQLAWGIWFRNRLNEDPQLRDEIEQLCLRDAQARLPARRITRVAARWNRAA